MILISTHELGKKYSAITLVSGFGSDSKVPHNAKVMAINQMIQEAKSYNADAIVDVQFSYSSSWVGKGISTHNYDLLVFGTAVKFNE